MPQRSPIAARTFLKLGSRISAFGPLQPYFDKSWRMDEIELSEVSKAIERIRHPIYENNIEIKAWPSRSPPRAKSTTKTMT